tara:strand:- start:234 stop:407 length:174 start_codon:yes stop_codon:yes gene_type:complete
MGIIQLTKDVILITPWLLSLFTFSIIMGILYLFLLFTSNLIFIVERLGGYIYGKRKT